MPQMMPIYWLIIYFMCLFSLILIMFLFNSYHIIKIYKLNFKMLKINKNLKKFKFKWN